MNTYITPELVSKGSITSLTQGSFEGQTDPDVITRVLPVGSVGFAL